MRKHYWKDVVHIQDEMGPRGGGVWFLTLECGHHKAVRKPLFRPEQDLVRATFGGKLPRAKKFEAPNRCRCLVCASEVAYD